MSKLDDALRSAPRTHKGPRCSIAALLSDLAPEERKALTDAIDGDGMGRITATALSIAIGSAYGVDIHRASIDRHRRHECLCSRRESK